MTILPQSQWVNSTVNIWQTCKTSRFNRFIGSYVTITSALTPTPSSLNKPKLVLRLSSSWGCLKAHIVLLKSKGLFTSTHSSAGCKTLCQAVGWRAKHNLYSLLFILLLNRVIFLPLSGLPFLGKYSQWYFSLGSGCISGMAASSPTLPHGSAMWTSLQAAGGGFGCSLAAFTPPSVLSQCQHQDSLWSLK